MRQKGSVCSFVDERNRELVKVFENISRNGEVISLLDVFGLVVNHPSSRFWVTEERASIVILRIIKGDKLESMRPTTREMYYEIYNRVMDIRATNPKRSISSIVGSVIHQPAPKFYMTPNSAWMIFYRIRNKRKQMLHS